MTRWVKSVGSHDKGLPVDFRYSPFATEVVAVHQVAKGQQPEII